jgi:hypothetical protein
MTTSQKPLWLWLDEDPLSSKLAELLSSDNGPSYYTWDPRKNFSHLVHSLTFEGVIIHATKNPSCWTEQGLLELWRQQAHLKMIVWGHDATCGRDELKSIFGREQEIYLWPKATINPLTFDSDRLALLGQNKFGQ